MTDTTDIAALSYARLIEVRNILSGFEDGYDTVADRENYEAMRDAQALIDELISARWQLLTVTTRLEAERQRADKVEKELVEVVKCYQRVTDERNSALYENAELRAKLANPVVLPRTLWYEHDDLPQVIPVLEKRLVIAGIHLAGFTTVKGE